MMFGLIRKRTALVVAGILAALCPMLMAPSGGFPSFPTFQQSTVNGTAGHTCPGATNTGTTCEHNTVAGHTAWVKVIQPLGTAGNKLGLIVDCTGGNSTDSCLRVQGATGTFNVDGTGAITSGVLTSGSYTGTIVGCTTSPTIQVLYSVIGTPTAGLVVLRFGTNSCTSNSTSFQVSGAPAAIRPTSLDMTLGAVDGCNWLDNTTSQCGKVSVGMTTTGLLNFFIAGSSTGWTAAGTKAVGVSTYSYPLQ